MALPNTSLLLPEFHGNPAQARRLLVRAHCPGGGPPADLPCVVDACFAPGKEGRELWLLLSGEFAAWEGALCRLAEWVGMRGGEILEARLVAGEADRIAELCSPSADGLARRFGLCLASGAAFGSGSHPSTRLAVLGLEELAAAGPLGRVCDVGCGSGILAMVAARLGADRVVALDVDGEAVATAKTNLRRNHMEARVLLLVGGVEAVGGAFDLLVANLPAAVVLRSLPALAVRLAPAGRLLLAGFLSGQEALLDERAGELALTLQQGWRHGVWGGRLYQLGEK